MKRFLVTLINPFDVTDTVAVEVESTDAISAIVQAEKEHYPYWAKEAEELIDKGE